MDFFYLKRDRVRKFGTKPFSKGLRSAEADLLASLGANLLRKYCSVPRLCSLAAASKK